MEIGVGREGLIPSTTICDEPGGQQTAMITLFTLCWVRSLWRSSRHCFPGRVRQDRAKKKVAFCLRGRAACVAHAWQTGDQRRLGIITVVVGAMLDLTLFLGKSVFFPAGVVASRDFDAISVLWVLASLLLLKRFKMNLLFVILLSIVFGVFRYQIGLGRS